MCISTLKEIVMKVLEMGAGENFFQKVFPRIIIIMIKPSPLRALG